MKFRSSFVRKRLYWKCPFLGTGVRGETIIERNLFALLYSQVALTCEFIVCAMETSLLGLRNRKVHFRKGVHIFLDHSISSDRDRKWEILPSEGSQTGKVCFLEADERFHCRKGSLWKHPSVKDR